MGLRIIDRHTPSRREISERERRATLAEATGGWQALKAKGREPGTEEAAQAEFLDHFQEVRASLNASPTATGELILGMAGRIRQSILGGWKDSALSHSQVDIATLLELL